jgi:hypothetical protein
MIKQLTYADFTVQALQEIYQDYHQAAVCDGDEQGVSWKREEEAQ